MNRRGISPMRRREVRDGFLFVSPLLVGLLLLTAWPIARSFYLSLTSYSIFTEPRFVGFRNYSRLASDPLFWKSLKVTAVYAGFSVPLGLIGSLAVALLMNQKVPGIAIFRTIYYLPAVVSGVAVSIVWEWLLNPQFGLINTLLHRVGIEGPQWLRSPSTALPSLILMSLWGVGGGMVVYLAGLQSVPPALYEAADIDGASKLRQFRHVTLPMITPVILYNLVMGMIGSFQTFTQAYVMTGGGPDNSTLLYVLYLYKQAFSYFHMGYASAMAWVLFAIVLVLTLFVFKTAKRWVYYEGERSR